MNLSIEISLYPLHDNYIPIIDSFLEHLHKHQHKHKSDNTEIRTNNMSTRIFGDYDAVMSLLTLTMKHAMEKSDKVVFITKFINADTRELKHYD